MVKQKPADAWTAESDRPARTFPSHAVENGRHIAVSYRNVLSSAWRCETYTLAHSPAALTFFALMVAMSLLGAMDGRTRGIGDILVPMAVTLSLGTAAVVGLLYAHLRRKFVLIGGRRDCTTILTKDGVYDVMPERTRFYAWGSFSRVMEQDGDVYLWSFEGGLYVPRQAFASAEECSRFVDTARILNKSRGREWENVLLPSSSLPFSPLSAPKSDTDR